MIKECFLKFLHHWKILTRDRAYRISLLIGIIVFVSGFFVNYVASIYNDNIFYPSVGDGILNKIPTYDLRFLFEEGFYFIVALIFLYPIFIRPELMPFMLKTYGILMMVRAGFIVMIEIGPPEGFYYANQSEIYAGPIKKFIFRNDLFFSAHTSVPFLAFLLMRGEKFRWLMFFASLTMASTVLLMHVHYSIDVFAAFFIAHGVYVLSDRIFNDLNKRFVNKIKLHGWTAFQKRMEKLKQRNVQAIKKFINKKKYGNNKSRRGA